MSEQINPFELLTGLGNEPGAANPFEKAPSLQVESTSAAPRFVELGSDDGADNPFTSQLQTENAPVVPDDSSTRDDETREVQSDPPQEIQAPDNAEVSENPLMAEIEKQEQQTIFAKLPIFVYGAAREEIQETGQTFDELRTAKMDEFLELEDAARVSWEITYGAVKKFISSSEAKKKKIGDVKQEIERSKDFTEKLKKAKDKNPNCEIKPRVTAQSKGECMPAYKGVFTDMEAADSSGKVICIVPGSDGNVYEIRNEEMGRFITPSGAARGLSEIKAGFIPALPLISSHQLMQIITFFRSFMSEDGNFEAIANIFWDRYEKCFVTIVPKQSVGSETAVSELSYEIESDRYLHYMDVHSHNVMPARFSKTDDKDERATRLYAVIGRLDQYLPDISVRLSNGGKYLNIDPDLVFEPLWAEYPDGWSDQVTRLCELPHPEKGGNAA